MTYDTGIDRKAGSAFRVRSRRKAALERLSAQRERGRKFVRELNTHADLTDADRARIDAERKTLVARIR